MTRDLSTITAQPPLRALLALAFPIMLAQLAQNAQGVVNALVAGRLGTEALATVALASAFYYLLAVACTGVILAVGPTVARAHGASQPEAAGQAFAHGLWLALALSTLVLPLYWNAGFVFEALGQSEAAARSALAYLRVFSLGLPAALGFVALRGLLEGSGRARVVPLFAAAGLGVSALLAVTLAFGLGPFPRLGVIGAGAASAIASWLTFGVALTYARKHLKAYRPFVGVRRPNRPALRALFTLGWPIGLTMGFESGMFSLTALVMGRFGEGALAAHGVASQTVNLIFNVPVGLALASSVLVAQALGRADDRGLRRAVGTGWRVTLGFMSLSALGLFFAARSIVGLFLDLGDPGNALVVETAVLFLKLAALFQVFDGAQVFLTAVLRGLGDTRVPMLISVASYWLVGLGSGMGLAFAYGLRGPGLWWGLVMGLAAAAVLLAVRLRGQLERAASVVKGAA